MSKPLVTAMVIGLALVAGTAAARSPDQRAMDEAQKNLESMRPPAIDMPGAWKSMPQGTAVRVVGAADRRAEEATRDLESMRPPQRAVPMQGTSMSMPVRDADRQVSESTRRLEEMRPR